MVAMQQGCVDDSSLPPSLPLLTEVALDACSSMRAGFDRLLSLDPPSFPPPSSSSSSSSSPSPSAPSSSAKKRQNPSSSSSSSSSSPPGQRLLEALIHSPSKQLSLQAASALLNLDVTSLVEEHR
jgi:hypothetical protein